MKDKDYLIYKPKPMYSLDADLESPSYFKTVPASLMPKEPEQLKAEPEVT